MHDPPKKKITSIHIETYDHK